MTSPASYQSFLDAFAALTDPAPQVLRSVQEHIVDGCVARLSLGFTTKQLTLDVSADDDTIHVGVEPVSPVSNGNQRSVEKEEPWRRLLGQPFAWGWITVNQQGYCDGALLSFTTIDPDLLIHVTASSLSVRCVQIVQSRKELYSMPPPPVLHAEGR